MLMHNSKFAAAALIAGGLTLAGAAGAQTTGPAQAPAKPETQAVTPAAQTPMAGAFQGEPEQGPPPAGMGPGQGPAQGRRRGPTMGPGWGPGPGMGLGPTGGRGPRMGVGMVPGQGARRGMGPGLRAARQRMPGAALRGRVLQQLNLTQDQQDQLKAFRQQQQKDAQALNQRARTSRQQLRETMKVDVPDEAAVKSAAAAVAAVQADRAGMQARAKAQTMKVLTPEQQQRLTALRTRANRMAAQRLRMPRQAARPQMMRRMNPMMGPASPGQPGAIRRNRWII